MCRYIQVGYSTMPKASQFIQGKWEEKDTFGMAGCNPKEWTDKDSKQYTVNKTILNSTANLQCLVKSTWCSLKDIY